MMNRVQYIFLELTNCHRALTPEATVLENFCYVLHNIENLPGQPDGLENEILRLLFDSARIETFVLTQWGNNNRYARKIHNPMTGSAR